MPMDDYSGSDITGASAFYFILGGCLYAILDKIYLGGPHVYPYIVVGAGFTIGAATMAYQWLVGRDYL